MSAAAVPPPVFPPRSRWVPVTVAVVFGCALVGYIRGIQPPPPLPRTAPPEPHASAAPPAVGYANIAAARRAPELVGPFDPVTRTEGMKLAALADRAKNRAFDGAPPTVPHPTDGMTTAANCLVCHGPGLRLGDRVATRMSHPQYSTCVQCHAPGPPAAVAAFAGPEPDNRFVGAYRAGAGERAGPGAPPTVPHTTWMRQDCTSCHGLVARPGLRTTHPWLTNCAQCHAPSAGLDQVAFPLPADEPPGGTP